MMEIKPEAKSEIILWDWLREYGEIYFNRKNILGVETFRVSGESKEIPDLLFVGRIFGKKEVIAIEVKDGNAGSNVRNANKIFKKYLLNYLNKKTKYFIEDKEITIDRFLVATQFSPNGHLFGYGDFIQKNGSWINKSFIGRCCPKLEFVRTKDFGRMILQDYSHWRKEHEMDKDKPSLGWLISDVILNFTEDELKVQDGMKGEPMIQGISWNKKLNRWGQFFTKLWKN